MYTKRTIRLVVSGILALLVSACFPPLQPLECPTTPGERLATEHIDGRGVTGISGRVVLRADKTPLAGAYVNIYPDTMSNLLGPSQFLSTPTDATGHYQVSVPPGSYYVVARKRLTGSPTGPLTPGDFYSEHQRILTQVVAGQLSVVDLPVVTMRAPMFFKKEVGRASDTGIRGRLVDSSGRPVPGAFAMAYRDAQMKRPPDHASTLSDADGQFTIYLPKAGTYYLAARIHAWDMPQHGEPYGKLGNDTQMSPVVVEPGHFVEGISIELRPFAGEYEAGKSRRPF